MSKQPEYEISPALKKSVENNVASMLNAITLSCTQQTYNASVRVAEEITAVESVEELNIELLEAMQSIAGLGADPITEHGCKTRADFMRHCDKMWIIARQAITKATQAGKE